MTQIAWQTGLPLTALCLWQWPLLSAFSVLCCHDPGILQYTGAWNTVGTWLQAGRADPPDATAPPAPPKPTGLFGHVKRFFFGDKLDKDRLKQLGMGAVASYGCVSNVTYGGGEQFSSNLHSSSRIIGGCFAMCIGPQLEVEVSGLPCTKSMRRTRTSKLILKIPQSCKDTLGVPFQIRSFVQMGFELVTKRSLRSQQASRLETGRVCFPKT